MTTLHLLTQSPFNENRLGLLEQSKCEQDAVMLLNDGVYAVTHPAIGNISHNCFALADDVNARGLNAQFQRHNIKLIDYSQLVELALQHHKSITW